MLEFIEGRHRWYMGAAQPPHPKPLLPDVYVACRQNNHDFSLHIPHLVCRWCYTRWDEYDATC